MNKFNFFTNKIKQKAFSIVEIIIYLAMFTFISIFVVKALIVSMSAFSSTHTNHIIMDGALSSMDRITREVRNANSIDISNSFLGVSSGILRLNTKDESGAVIAVMIKKEANGNINIYKSLSSNPTDLVLVGNLLNSSIVADSLIFRRIDTVAGEAMKIEMLLRDTKNLNNRTEKFYNTVILRGAY